MNTSQVELPAWVQETTSLAFKKISQCELLISIYEGDLASLKYLVWLFWPFVDKFPSAINTGCRAAIKQLGHQGSTFRQMALGFHKTPYDLQKEYLGDESQHREYWLRMGEKLNLTLAPDSKSTTNVERLSETVRDKSDLVRLCYRFVGVEVVAEQFTEYLMGSAKFRSYLPGDSLNWFHAHRHHPEALHTRIGLGFASKLSGDQVDESQAQQHILGVVDTFIRAAQVV